MPEATVLAIALKLPKNQPKVPFTIFEKKSLFPILLLEKYNDGLPTIIEIYLVANPKTPHTLIKSMLLFRFSVTHFNSKATPTTYND